MSARRWFDGDNDPLNNAAELREYASLTANPRKLSVPLAQQQVIAAEHDVVDGDPLSILERQEEDGNL